MWHKYRQRWQSSNSLVCVGLDPQLHRLPECVQDAQNPILEFNKAIIDATREYACCYKPNLAFYLADGLRGLEALSKTVSYIPKEIPVILDCKVGDIGSTMQGYVSAFFDRLKVDAITVNPLMGSDVLDPILDHEAAFAFVLGLTSNPSAKDFFIDKRMDIAVGEWIDQFPAERVGAVVGATQSQYMDDMREMLHRRLILIPGVGAQGAQAENVVAQTIYSKEEPNILINSSRAIIYASRGDDFAAAAADAAKKLRAEILGALAT
jgi:orotidine-5'-phosphate decarboxylase